MQALTKDVQDRHPGVVVYGVGDADHKLHISDHNEDDTPGSRPAQEDADSIPEHRAIDVMMGPNFSKEDANRLVANLLSDPSARIRMKFIIFDGSIWSRNLNWQKKTYTGTNQHRTHIHVSGWAPDDENTDGWPAVHKLKPDTTPVPPAQIYKVGSKGTTVTHIQQFLRNKFPAYRNYVTYKRGQFLVVDGIFGQQTEAWVKEFQRRTNLTRDGIVGPKTFAKMRQYGYKY